MPLYLTPEQEQTIHAAVTAGAYESAEEALDAAVASITSALSPDFEGTPEELEGLLSEGVRSGEAVPVDEAFWTKLSAKTEHIAAEHASGSDSLLTYKRRVDPDRRVVLEELAAYDQKLGI